MTADHLKLPHHLKDLNINPHHAILLPPGATIKDLPVSGDVEIHVLQHSDRTQDKIYPTGTVTNDHLQVLFTKDGKDWLVGYIPNIPIVALVHPLASPHFLDLLSQGVDESAALEQLMQNGGGVTRVLLNLLSNYGIDPHQLDSTPTGTLYYSNQP